MFLGSPRRWARPPNPPLPASTPGSSTTSTLPALTTSTTNPCRLPPALAGSPTPAPRLTLRVKPLTPQPARPPSRATRGEPPPDTGTFGPVSCISSRTASAHLGRPLPSTWTSPLRCFGSPAPHALAGLSGPARPTSRPAPCLPALGLFIGPRRAPLPPAPRPDSTMQ